MTVPISANLDERLAANAREVAKVEHRTLSNVVANALLVFLGMPKELRDILLELSVDPNSPAFRSVVQEMSALAAKRKLEIAFQRLVDEKKLPELPQDASELDLLEKATALSRGV
jgi:hypothetical protein